MKELAQQAMATAQLRGARYADIRIIESRTQTAGVKDGNVDSLGDFESVGFGVRVLVGNSWGFASSADITREDIDRTTALAVEIARASALVPGMAAREIAVGALGTVYSMSASGDDVAGALSPIIASTWSLATALSLLAWYVFAPQCLSTLAVVKRETNSWRYPLIMAGYLFALAYLASFITYRVAVALGGG